MLLQQIKQKLIQIKNWLKDKWIRFWTWFKKQKKKVLAILGIGVALAAGSQIVPNGEWMPPENCFIVSERNFENIQFEKLRKKIDKKYNDLHDELSIAYYCYWKYGQSKPFRGYDVKPTLEENKRQFDELQACLSNWYEIYFHEENLKQAKKDRIPEEQYNQVYDVDGNVVGKRSDKALEKIQELKNKGIELNL